MDAGVLHDMQAIMAAQQQQYLSAMLIYTQESVIPWGIVRCI